MMNDVRGGIIEREFNACGALDSIMFSETSCFDLSGSEQQRMRADLAWEAFEYHRRACGDYASYVERLDGGAVSEIAQIPVYPVSMFKMRPPCSADEGSVEAWYQSSGTSGLKSKVPRDRLTLQRLLGSVRTGLHLVDNWSEDDLAIINLGPELSEAGEVWFPYVMGLVELLYPTVSVVRNGKLDTDLAIRSMRDALDHRKHVGLVGPPYFVQRLMQALAQQGVVMSAKERLTVLTAGGWKRHTGAAVARHEFMANVLACFDLSSPAQVRDAFNQVELNSVIFECSNHQKHVPPWVYVGTCDPYRLVPQDAGVEGVLFYLDASATSYPAFILSDDIGTVREGRCACGREGLRVEVSRRLETRDSHGCALRMEKLYVEP